MKLKHLLFLIGLTSILGFASCEKQEVNPTIQTESSKKLTGATLTEGFETGTKTAYAAADVTLGTGVWNLNDALIGNTTSDRKSGVASARVRNSGSVTMKFDRTTGAGTVEVYHAKYGTDANSTWELWQSVNGGTSWTKVGSTITTSSTTLSAVTFAVNVSGTVRFEIRKTDGTTSRINIDAIAISDYATSGGSTGGGTPSSSEHLILGNPSAAVTSTSYPTNYLFEKAQYVMSYNRDKGTANWVSWHLNASWIGSTARQDDFRNDTALPAGWYQVLGTSYSGSGFDRGHMCPSADRTLTVTDNSATFLMTNMIPQAPDNNQGPWANLENYCRTLVDQGNELYIVSGGYGQGGTGSNGAANTINGGLVWVPSHTWKVIVIIPEGTNDLSRIGTSTRVIAVDMPNQQGIRSVSWGTYRTTVDAIESATGYDIMSAVSTTIQATLESAVDTGATN